MNCKPNDLAIVVNDMENPANNGALVRVLRRADPRDYDLPVDWDCEALSAISGPLSFSNEWCTVLPGDESFGFRDCELRPLRDNPGEDETLQWVPVPKKEVA